VLDRRKVGLGLTVFVELKIEGHSTKTAARLEKIFAAMEEVVACHIVSGPSDFLLEVVVEDLEVYEHFLLDTLLEVPGVSDVRSNFVISTIKSHGALPLGTRRSGAAPAARSRQRRA
jgi:Lrp/AsnC family leucine-responsive transcriptional regulator